MGMKAVVAAVVGLVFLGIASVATVLIAMSSDLPKMIKVEDYEPLLVSQVYDRNGEKIGEFLREKRILVSFDKIPEHVVQAFVSAEDSSFFEHSGINFVAIFRSAIANLRAGRKVQGGSTITQQVARSLLLLSNEKTYTRKIKEAILAYRMESNLSKKDILYLYLNQIYLGQGAWGVGAAADVYFRKPLSEITVAEAALLAGLPQAPSRYSPISNPSAAKERQRYVLKRMAEEGYITHDKAEEYTNLPIGVYVRDNYVERAPHFLETVRLLLTQELGGQAVLDRGLKIYTGLDLAKQTEAQNQVRRGLRELDKRQGYRGPQKNIEAPEEIAKFLLETRNKLMDDFSPLRTIRPDGTISHKGPLNLTGKNTEGKALPNLPEYIQADQIVNGIVTRVDDQWGLVYVRFAESKALLDLEGMKWARKPNPEQTSEAGEIKKPSDALKKGDVISIKIVGKEFQPTRINELLQNQKKKLKAKFVAPKDLPTFVDYAAVELEQDPDVEGALIAIDQNNGDIISMVGGYDFQRSEFNRAIQAARQTGSAFKTLVYAAALDKNYTPASLIIDAPVVFEEQVEEGQGTDELITKRWKPTNHGQDFTGDILFRNALIRSLNIPTVKIIEDIGVDWVVKYSRRLGIFSPLNLDFTLALGSSGVTVYQMTKVFAELGRMGRKVSPVLIHKVESNSGEVLLENVSMDKRFQTEIKKIEEEIETWREGYQKEQEQIAADGTSEGDTERKKMKSRKFPPLFFEDPDQLIKPTTAYLITSMLQGVIEEPGGTGGAARSIGRPAAGKTGSTSGYFDAWFVGYTPDIATGVWVGYDEEKTLGRGEVGGRSALPIWLDYMKFAHDKLPVRSFPVPDGIVFANIDNKTGRLASATSQQIVRQAFAEGTEPKEVSGGSKQEEQDFFKEDLSE